MSYWEEKYGGGDGGVYGSSSSPSNYAGIPSSIVDGSAFEVTYTAAEIGM